jgi:hypothetical protein
MAPIRSANPVWTFPPSGSPLSAMRSATHRGDLYDLTYSSWVSIQKVVVQFLLHRRR